LWSRSQSDQRCDSLRAVGKTGGVFSAIWRSKQHMDRGFGMKSSMYLKLLYIYSFARVTGIFHVWTTCCEADDVIGTPGDSPRPPILPLIKLFKPTGTNF
jgi:hypothetical protein